MLTTFYSYGTVAPNRQAEIIKTLGAVVDEPPGHELEWARKMVRVMREAGMSVP